MMSSSEESTTSQKKKYRGVRCRKWGKWVSEIRVPATQDRLWLGSYSTPEAAAVAHDVAYYHLRGPSSSWENFNFPHMLPTTTNSKNNNNAHIMSPKSVQKAASDAGMAIDAQLITQMPTSDHEVNANANANASGEIWEEYVGGSTSTSTWEGISESRSGEALSISIEDYL